MKAKRPKPIGIGEHDSVRIRVARGPRADGRWYWRADRQIGKKRERVWMGWGTPKEAEQETIRSLAEEQGEPLPVRSVEQVRTVHDLLDTWAAAQGQRTDISAFTRRNADGAAARLSGGIGQVLVASLDRRVLERYRDRSTDSGATVARDLKYLRQAWRWGREVGAVPIRDLPSIKVVRKTPVRTRFTPERGDVAKLLAYVRRHSGPAFRAVVLLSATGARPSELLSLRWSGVAPDGSWIEVVGKTGPRRVELHPAVAAEIRTWERNLDALVVGCSGNTVRRHLADGAVEGKIAGRVSPTGMRRYVVDCLYDSPGSDIAANAAQMGHSAETAIRVYKSKIAKKQRAAVLAAGLDLPEVESEGAEVYDIATGQPR